MRSRYGTSSAARVPHLGAGVMRLTRSASPRSSIAVIAGQRWKRSGVPPALPNLDRMPMALDRKDVPTLRVLADEWLARRRQTHRAAGDDESRWENHLNPWFGSARPGEVDAAAIRKFVEAKLVEKLAPSTVRLCIMLLSSLYGDLVERSLAETNAVRTLPRATKRLYKSSYDPRTTPFIEKLEDVSRIVRHLPEPLDIAYAVGVLAGLRTGEVLALRWENVNLETRRIFVRESIKCALKDKDSRVVILQDDLHEILSRWRPRTGGTGRVVPSMRSDGVACNEHTLGKHLRSVLRDLNLPRVTWYHATRRTFASQWALQGGSIEKLKEMMGHCSVTVTERYAHLRADLFAERDFGTIKLGLDCGTPRRRRGHPPSQVCSRQTSAAQAGC